MGFIKQLFIFVTYRTMKYEEIVRTFTLFDNKILKCKGEKKQQNYQSEGGQNSGW